ncbi:MAG: hypothetical protein ACP5IA_11985 [Sediminispirochaetaceae bacterium]
MQDRQNQSTDAPNRRSRRRVKAEKLPPGMREFRLEFGPKEVYKGTTIDASLTGISFLVEVPSNRIHEHIVKLISADKKISMTQELVYIKAVDETHSRISLLFDTGSTPQLYRNVVGKALGK